MLIDGAGREITTDQYMAWVICQAIRNRLEMFHGGEALDPENPDAEEGFITDKQMRALNIVIRYTVYEALDAVGMREDGKLSQQAAAQYCLWQLRTVNPYMEPPGSPELRRAYVEVSGDDRPEVQDWPWDRFS